MTSTPADTLPKAHLLGRLADNSDASVMKTSPATTYFQVVVAQFIWLIPSCYYAQKYMGRASLAVLPLLATLAILLFR